MEMNKHVIQCAVPAMCNIKLITVMVSDLRAELQTMICSLTVEMVDGGTLFLGFLSSKERTVSISNSFRPSLLVSGLKQQPPESRKDSLVHITVKPLPLNKSKANVESTYDIL